MSQAAEPITGILADIRAGRASVSDLLPLVYDDLRNQARRLLRGRRAGSTLQTTALVHDAALRLLASSNPHWHDRAHFFAAAARAMRQILSNHARDRCASKRGGGWKQVALTEPTDTRGADLVDLLALDEALTELTALDERMAQVVECRFFASMQVEEIAHVLSVSVSTVESDWRVAKAWLSGRLHGGNAG